MNEKTILIVGAGIFGVTAAVELNRRGHRVHLIDPGPLPHPAASSTDISKVIRMGYGSDLTYLQMMEAALDGWESWNRAWDTPLYHPTGVTWLTTQPMTAGNFEYENYQLIKNRGHDLDRLTPETIAARFPAWGASPYIDGYHNPRGGWAESGAVVAELIGQAKAAGVTFHIGESFAHFLEAGSRVAGIRTQSGQHIPGDYVILAAGAWTPTLHPDLDGRMWATAQDVLHFRVQDIPKYQPPNFTAWGADIATTGWYGFPAKDDGTLKVANHGVGRPLDPSSAPNVLPTTEGKFRDFFRRNLPELVDAPLIHTRVCFYADTWDGDFWIDHDPVREGVMVASGGSGHAFKFAPILGALVADVLERKPNPYKNKFIWRAREDISTEDARFAGDKN